MTSKKYVSSSQETLHVVNEVEDRLPPPPLPPTVEFLVGKRPVNLRGRRVVPQQMDTKDGDEEYLSDFDSDHSSVSSSHSDRRSHQKKKAKKKKRRDSREDDAFDWQYNKLTVPQSSPPRERRGIARKPTPKPADLHSGGQISSTFDEVSCELEMASSLSFESPLNSPSPNSTPKSLDQASLSHTLEQKSNTNGHLQAKQAALPQQNRTEGLSRTTDSQPKRAAPISLMGSSRKSPAKQQLEEGGSQQFNSRSIAAMKAMPSSFPITTQPPAVQSPSPTNENDVQVCIHNVGIHLILTLKYIGKVSE